MTKLLIANCDGGLGNRFNTLIGCIALSRLTGLSLKVLWPRNDWCEANLPDVFDTTFDYSNEEIAELSSGRVNQLKNQPIQQVGGFFLFSYHNLPPVDQFLTIANSARNGVGCAFTHLPTHIPRAALLDAGRYLKFNKTLVQKADDFISREIGMPYFGIHLRRTDITCGFQDWEIQTLASKYSQQRIYLCSDDPSSEARFRIPNIVIKYDKRHVIKKQDKASWTKDTYFGETNSYIYPSNVRRTQDSILDAVVDLLLLSNSRLIGDSVSTFFLVAQFLQEVEPKFFSHALALPKDRPILHIISSVANSKIPFIELLSCMDQIVDPANVEAKILVYKTWISRADNQDKWLGHYNLAVAEKQLGRYKNARASLEASLVLNPDFDLAKKALGIIGPA
jgi:hypothetical protein